MKREDLEHVIRAAADATGELEIVVVGSQAILAQFPEAPDPLLRSQEADVYPRNHPEKAVEIDAALGDGSRFHESFGYYAHGVGPETAKAPAGWAARLIRMEVALRPGRPGEATAWCMEAHDLVLAKLVAARDKDLEFAELAIRHRLVRSEELLRRAVDLPIEQGPQRQVRKLLEGVIARVEGSNDVSESEAMELAVEAQDATRRRYPALGDLTAREAIEDDRSEP